MDVNLTELCQELRNWFERERYSGTFEIKNGEFVGTNVPPVQEGIYFRICGSWFNDGIHQYPDSDMRSESFTGSVWLLSIPAPVLQLAEEINAWRAKYEAADSAAMSPYMSESFGGYSYQKGSALSSSDTSGAVSWKRTFAGRMNAWRKL